MAKTTKLGTARKEYQRLKIRYPDSIVLFRIEGFYEAFFEDVTESVGSLPAKTVRAGSGFHLPWPLPTRAEQKVGTNGKKQIKENTQNQRG